MRDQNDDLNAQILSLSLYEAKSLFSCHTKAQCLAAEIDNASRDEVSLLMEDESNVCFYTRLLIYFSFFLPLSARRRSEGTGGDQPASEAVHGQNHSGHS